MSIVWAIFDTLLPQMSIREHFATSFLVSHAHVINGQPQIQNEREHLSVFAFPFKYVLLGVAISNNVCKISASLK